MSLILEALKKSERQRRLGETPSLGTPVSGVRRRRSRLPVLVGLIAVALAVGWWLRRAPPAETPVAESPAASATTAAVAPARNAEGAGAPGPTFADSPDNRQRVQGNAAERMPRSRVPADANAGINPALREKLASGELVVANPALLKPGQAATVKESAPMPADSAPSEQTVPVSPPIAPAVATESAAPAIAPRTAPSRERSVEAPPPTRRDATATTAPPPPPPAAAEAGVAGPQLLWALPYAQRRGIPEIKLSMHVYAAEPAQRFVIVNGNRQVEGDTFEGLKLIEIRNDGIVLEREGLRFVYPRGGR